MTLYLLFDSLRAGRITLQTQLAISRHAAAQLPVNLSLAPGMTMSVETAIKAIVVRSANDVAVAIAEAVGGTEGHFAELMTARARELGMRDTFYHNASGLPDRLQITTASDLAILARRLAYDYPQYFPYFATLSFNYRGASYYTHDNLLGRFQGTDGIKTGYTNASGFNLVSSVVRDGAHVIGVVMGGDTARARDNEMVRLLATTFKRAQANPALIAHGTIPWQSQSALPTMASGLPPGPGAVLTGLPAPVVLLSAPSINTALVGSGEMNEDAAESGIGLAAAAAPAANANCALRGIDRRV
jgi:D-alanyl-D-alanine carboxypeptidase